MKRASRTTITWRFENTMAPHGKMYMPMQCWGLSLVSVVVTFFHGKLHFRAWLMDSRSSGQELRNKLKDYFFGSPSSRAWTESLGLLPDYGEDYEKEAVGANGDTAHVDFVFQARNGESATRTACLIFIAFCDEFAAADYRNRYYLPTPEIVQETMVEAHAQDNWISYGQYVWEKEFAHIADANVKAQ